jgi:ATP-binding cassette subfamily B protein
VVSFERVFEVIDLPVEVKNPEDAILLDYMEGDIKFQSVSFGYGMIPDGIRTGLEEQKRYGQQAKTGGACISLLCTTFPCDDLITRVLTYVLDWRSGMDPKYDLSFGLEDEYAVRDVTFHIKPGQMCALVGRSGAGKRFDIPFSILCY